MVVRYKPSNGRNTEYHHVSPSTLLEVQRTALGECVQRTRSQPYFLLFTYLLGLGVRTQTDTHTSHTSVHSYITARITAQGVGKLHHRQNMA